MTVRVKTYKENDCKGKNNGIVAVKHYFWSM